MVAAEARQINLKPTGFSKDLGAACSAISSHGIGGAFNQCIDSIGRAM